jgi:hypothetical protein
MPFSLWLPRAAVWTGVVLVAALTIVWLISPNSDDLLGVIGGIWAIARVSQFIAMKITGQA